MKIESLNEFIMLVKCQSFTRASQELYLSQPNLSAHIQAMERELGFDVVDRSRKSFALTPAGMNFLGYAQTIVDAYNEGRASGKSLSNSRPVRITGVYPHTPLFHELRTSTDPVVSFPAVDYNITALDALASNEVDVAITADFSHTPSWVEKAAACHIVTDSLPSGRSSIVVSRINPLSRKERLAREDLRGATFMVGSYAYYDLYRNIVLTLVGNDLGLSFKLVPVANEIDASITPLGNNLYLCGADKVASDFEGRSDIVIFDELDGKPLVGTNVLAYRASDCERLAPLLMRICAAFTKSVSHSA